MTLACDSGGSKTLLHIYNKDELIEEYHLPGVAAALDSQEDLPELRKHLNTIKEKYPIRAPSDREESVLKPPFPPMHNEKIP